MNFIEILKYILLGLVQGIAEILPISSSGHLALLQSLLMVNPDSEALFAIFVHFASLLALVLFFYKTLWQIIKGFFSYLFKHQAQDKDAFMMVIYLVVATIPAALVGVLLEDQITGLFGDLLYVGIGFLITATLLFLWPLFGKKAVNQIGWKHVLFAGLFQAFGVLPGVSRSGITMTGAKIAGLQHKPAKQFAFLLFVPIALGSFLLSLTDLGQVVTTSPNVIGYYAIAMVTAFIATLLALFFIFKKFQDRHAPYFGIYLVVLGVMTIISSLL